MKEIWVKKIVYRRYLIENDKVEEVKAILSENTQQCVDVVVDCYDKNDKQEYDNEQAVLPIIYSISEEIELPF